MWQYFSANTHMKTGIFVMKVHSDANFLIWSSLHLNTSMTGFIETDIHFPKVRISSEGKRIRFTKTGTALGATAIRLPRPRIVLGEMDMFLEVSIGHEIDMSCTQIAVSPRQ